MVGVIQLFEEPIAPLSGVDATVLQIIFLAVHAVIFLFAIVFGARAFGAGEGGFGWGFTFIALGEVSYVSYHLGITDILFAHTIAEVLLLLTFGGTLARKGVFGGAVREAADRASM
jgi:hypothetical protein